MKRTPLTCLLFTLSVAFTFWGCQSSPGGETPYLDFLHQNSESSSQLALGMSREEVRIVMGDAKTRVADGPISNPWRVEATVNGTDSFEFLYYLVHRHPPFNPIRKSQAISVVLQNGEVIAWGQDADEKYRQ